MSRNTGRIWGSEQGMVLVMVLMVMALLTAMVVEFAYGVQVKTDMLNNWQSLQKLSLASNSSVSVAAKIIDRLREKNKDVYMLIPAYQVFDQPMNVSLSITDEYARFNLNKLVLPNGTLDRNRYAGMLRMLESLSLDAEVADRIVDWIDPDQFSMLPDSESGNHNANLISIEEVSQIPGISPETYAKLLPYITVYGKGEININLATEPVLMAIAEDMTEDMARLIISSRQGNPFRKEGDLNQAVPGFATIIKQVPVTFKGDLFRVVSIAMDTDSLIRTVECILRPDGTVVYWRET